MVLMLLAVFPENISYCFSPIKQEVPPINSSSFHGFVNIQLLSIQHHTH
jgi:hypothetical protein